jgi:hypothetical protein
MYRLQGGHKSKINRPDPRVWKIDPMAIEGLLRLHSIDPSCLREHTRSATSASHPEALAELQRVPQMRPSSVRRKPDAQAQNRRLHRVVPGGDELGVGQRMLGAMIGFD